MEWLVLFMLILIGFVLLILEFLVFPGVNVAGILGFACVESLFISLILRWERRSGISLCWGRLFVVSE